MKKILLVAAATASMLSMNAESVTINHVTSGALATELQAAIDADPDDALTALSDITELTIVGEAALNNADFTSLRTNLQTTLRYLNLSEATIQVTGDAWNPGGGVKGMTELVEVVLPSSLRSLAGFSFDGCSKLEKVNLENVTLISNQCFRNCSKFKLEALPANLTSIQAEAFRNCTSLTLGGEMPETLTQIRNFAFSATSVAFTKLPDGLKSLEQNAFQSTKVSFSQLPKGITDLNTQVFAGTNCTFSTIPAQVEKVGDMVFQSVKTLPEFTIPNQANLWTKIPKGFFYVNENIERSFICRAPTAPEVTVVTGGNWDETFGRPAMCTNTTMKVLASAMESYEATAPYSSMQLVALTTPVQAPMIDIDGGDASKCIVTLTVAGKDHQDFTEEVYEGEGDFTIEVASVASNNEAFYIERISYLEPEVYAEGDEEAEEPTDQNLLYAATGDIKNLVDQPVTVPVTVEPGMKQLYVKVSNAYYFLTGVEAVDAPANTVRRVGDTVYTTLPGAQLYDLAGRMVARTASNTIDLSGLPAGTYILRAGNTTMKILK